MKLLNKLLLITLLISNFVSKADTIPENRTSECLDFLKKLPSSYTYGWITQPLIHSDANSRKLNIFYYYKRASHKSRPWISFYNGGPGGNTHSYHQKIVKDLDKKLNDFNFIIVDQRGNGCSDQYPTDLNQLFIELPYFYTRAIVQDSEAVRKKLIGQNKWIVYGQSFGSLTVQRYISMFPNSLVGAVAHGWAANSKPEIIGIERMKAHDMVLKEFFKRFPDDKEKLEYVLSRVSNFCYSFDHKNVCGNQLFAHVGQSLGFHSTWEKKHKAINKMVNLDTGKIDMKEFVYFFWSYEYLKNHVKDSVNIYWNRFEAYIPKEDSLNAYYKKAHQDLLGQGIDVSTWPLGEESMMQLALESVDTQFIDQAPLPSTDPLTPQNLKLALEKNKNLKFYLFSAEYDTYAPPSVFKEMVDVLGDRLNYKEIKDAGHESYRSQACIQSLASLIE